MRSRPRALPAGAARGRFAVASAPPPVDVLKWRRAPCKLTGGLALLAAALAFAIAAAPGASGAGGVVLGSRAFALPDGSGWGTARPSKIFNGGDPSGLVSDIHWRSWGGPSASGSGLTSIFKPAGGYYRRLVRVQLRAQAIGRCSSRGPRAYTLLQFRVPSRPGGRLGAWTPWAGSGKVCRPGA